MTIEFVFRLFKFGRYFQFCNRKSLKAILMSCSLSGHFIFVHLVAHQLTSQFILFTAIQCFQKARISQLMQHEIEAKVSGSESVSSPPDGLNPYCCRRRSNSSCMMRSEVYECFLLQIQRIISEKR
jgi:hypothetical protein